MVDTGTRTAVLVGASGLTGNYLLREILQSALYSKVICISRKELFWQSKGTKIEHPKLENVIVNFDNLEEYAHKIKGDDLFCTLGTTIKKAGTYDNFLKVDVEYPFHFAEKGKRNGSKNFFLLSSIGANALSGNNYLRAKGQLEEKIKNLHFESLHVFRPSLLLGSREEIRIAETLAKALLLITGFLLVGKWRRYKAIESLLVAKAMCKAAELNISSSIHYYDDMVKLSASEF